MRPSRFSKDYYKIMRRRRINITLSILLIISIFYFFGDRLLGLVSINIKMPKIPGIHISNPFVKEDKQEVKNNIQQEEKNKQSQTKEQTLEVVKYTYTKSDGTIVEILIDETSKKIAGLKDTSAKTNYMIDDSKNYLVFDDIKAGKILICDAYKNVSEISKDNYKSRNLNKTFYRIDILKANPSYIWAAKPYITKDNRIVYISQLPYFKKDAEFHLWAYDLKTKQTRRIGPLGTNKIDAIDFKGYSGDTLVIVTEQTAYKLDLGSYKLHK